MKLLVLTPEPIDAQALRAAAGDGADGAEVLVISPAVHESGLRFWMSDADEAIAAARETAEETAELLSEDGIDAVGDTGESEPAIALQDALATFPADRIVVFHRSADEQGYREADGLDELGVPITFSEISP
jgi:nucleotide-binding universal stress UspA family protein